MTTSHACTRSTLDGSPTAAATPPAGTPAAGATTASLTATARPRYMGARLVAVLAAVLALGGCARSVEPSVEVPPDVVVPGASSLLESCLLGGGELTLRHEVNNNDTSPHGDVVSFTVSGDRLAVGSADGTIKLWTLDGFVATVASGALTYGPELATTEPRDLTFFDEEIVSGDARGLVTAFQTTGEMRVLGGTAPETAIVAIAIAPATLTRGGFPTLQSARLAHADTQAGGNVIVRELDGDVVVGPLATALDSVTDLQFADDGTLLVAGTNASSGGLQRYDVSGARTATAPDAGAVRAIDTVGALVAAVTDDTLSLYDDALSLRGRILAEEHAPLGVALSAHGRIAFTIGADQSLLAWDTETGAVLARIEVPAAVRIDTSPDADTAFVAARDGWLRAYGCRALTP